MNVIVTGAASGIGRAVAAGLVRSSFAGGASRLFLVDRAAEPLEALAAELRAERVEVGTFLGDLADPEVPARIVAQAEASFGGLDAIVSNAGAIKAARLKDLDVQDFDEAFAINARATWLLGKAAHHLLSRSRGSIVATASISAEHATPTLGAYSASKAALVMLMRQMALDWGPDGIRCNCVSPGPTVTGMTAQVYSDPGNRAAREAVIPLRVLNSPEDIANAILFLISPAAATISGVNLNVDGGMTTSLMTASGGGTGHR